MAADLPAKHVPAWKRIGLKLKYAKDTPEPSPRRDDHKRSASEQDSLGPSKRRKTSPVAEPLESESRRKSVTFTPDTKTEDGFSASRIFKQWMTPPLQPVTSTTEDPFDNSPSPKKIARPVQSVDVAPPAKDPDSTSPSSLSSLEQATQKDKKKPKQKKAKTGAITVKSKQDASAAAAAAAINPSDVHQPEYLRYLTTFHSDKVNWKFNKKKQTELLKHCLDTVKIPPQHTPALKDYLKGLKGVALAKKIFEEADALLKIKMSKYKSLADIAGMEDPEARKFAYETQLKRNQDEIEMQVDEWERALDNGYELSAEEIEEIQDAKRAEQEKLRSYAVLEATLSNFNHPEGPQRPMPPELPADQPLSWYKKPDEKKAKHTKFEDDDESTMTSSSKLPKKKTRKSRTADDSSSESSSSSDESSSSEDDSSSNGSSNDSSSEDDDSTSEDDSSSDDEQLTNVKTKKAVAKTS